ncbi:GNAT family N-acetyltransferase [Nonomuraea jiangxiensis]|uniref:Ribosomal-protein-alanine N-acetyltransferase n=1 Tax=Nonomuraea jiangxiensis TaxID=633440 RepID=A0A1G8TY62_9ACTN|nr:GNAT family N-acetyltransferase [Nonomuraea jiangxiensis]SDJ46441.1 ribosomal-protein-alanine N-acetyltransferase [Nonomuraea jiangxiensis]
MIDEVPLSGGVTLRLITEQDADALADAYVRNRDHLLPWEPRRPADFFTPQGQADRLKDVLDQYARGQAVPWALADGDLVVGRVTLNTIVRGPFLNADLGYWVDGGYTGRGLATEAVVAVCRIADEILGLHRIAASTLLHNESSQSVLRRTGFELVGTAPNYLEIDGRWQDCRIYQRILNDRPAF